MYTYTYLWISIQPALLLQLIFLITSKKTVEFFPLLSEVGPVFGSIPALCPWTPGQAIGERWEGQEGTQNIPKGERKWTSWGKWNKCWNSLRQSFVLVMKLNIYIYACICNISRKLWHEWWNTWNTHRFSMSLYHLLFLSRPTDLSLHHFFSRVDRGSHVFFLVVKWLKGWKVTGTEWRVPSWKLTYPSEKSILKMIFLFPRWDMLVPSRLYLLEKHQPKNKRVNFNPLWLVIWNGKKVGLV